MRLKDGRAVPNFITQALKNEPITMYGDGSQTRSFCFVTDLIDGIYRLSLSDLNEPVNIGNPNEITIKEFAFSVIRLTQSKSKLKTKPLPKDDPRQRKPDISRAKEKLKWQPKIDLEDGLVLTVEWFKQHV
jgi:dTDP-glucose 4,6-dehydratase